MMTSRSKATRTLISLTPLIDIVFILLIFFMLTSSFLDWHIIDLNLARNSTTAVSKEEDFLMIKIDHENLHFAGEIISLEQLSEQLHQRMINQPDLAILLQPLQGVPLQKVVQVMDLAVDAGATQLALLGRTSP
ncbi:MAG: biopolymer transporter ExbD [Aphanocapsa feldmannii 288cV]|nr:MAG: biopolymer transporter ExbD [Aphanocapsa feldmannii 288cV]